MLTPSIEHWSPRLYILTLVWRMWCAHGRVTTSWQHSSLILSHLWVARGETLIFAELWPRWHVCHVEQSQHHTRSDLATNQKLVFSVIRSEYYLQPSQSFPTRNQRHSVSSWVSCPVDLTLVDDDCGVECWLLATWSRNLVQNLVHTLCSSHQH